MTSGAMVQVSGAFGGGHCRGTRLYVCQASLSLMDKSVDGQLCDGPIGAPVDWRWHRQRFFAPWRWGPVMLLQMESGQSG